jgi:hypothetical protein
VPLCAFSWPFPALSLRLCVSARGPLVPTVAVVIGVRHSPFVNYSRYPNLQPPPVFSRVIFQRIRTYDDATCRLRKNKPLFARRTWHLRKNPVIIAPNPRRSADACGFARIEECRWRNQPPQREDQDALEQPRLPCDDARFAVWQNATTKSAAVTSTSSATSRPALCGVGGRREGE